MLPSLASPSHAGAEPAELAAFALQPATPQNWYAGVWQGGATQLNPSRTYTVSIALTGTTSHPAGIVAYPALACGGELSLDRADDKIAVFSEHITYGSCVDEGAITLKRSQSDTLDLHWTGDGTINPQSTVTSNLKRTGGTVADAWYSGFWRGNGLQTNPPRTYGISISLAQSSGLSGLIAYPSLACGGELTVLSVDDKAAVFSEHITYGPCVDKGTITLKRAPDNAVDLLWTGEGTANPQSTVTGTLTGAGGGQPVTPGSAVAPALPGRLVYATATPTGWSFAGLAPDGGPSSPLPIGEPGCCTNATLSPQGSRMAYGEFHSLSVSDSDGTHARPLWSDPARIPTDLAWSPDSSEIAFIANDSGTGEGVSGSALYVIGVDGSGLRELGPTAPATRGGLHGLAWSPDGSQIAFGDQTDIFAVASSGGLGDWLVGTLNMTPFSLSWSPAGSLLFEELNVAPAGIWQANADGTGVRSLLPGGHSPSWGPDGTHFAAVLNDRIVVVDGSGAVQATIGPPGVPAVNGRYSHGSVRWGGGVSSPPPIPSASFTVGLNPSTSSTVQVDFDACASAPPTSSGPHPDQYIWSFPDGTVVKSAQCKGISHDLPTGIQTVSLTVEYGLFQAQAVATFDVIATPPITQNQGSSGCSDFSVGDNACWRAGLRWFQDIAQGPNRVPDYMIVEAVGLATGVASVIVTCDGTAYLSTGAGVADNPLEFQVPVSVVAGWGFVGDPRGRLPTAQQIDNFVSGSTVSAGGGGPSGVFFVYSPLGDANFTMGVEYVKGNVGGLSAAASYGQSFARVGRVAGFAGQTPDAPCDPERARAIFASANQGIVKLN